MSIKKEIGDYGNNAPFVPFLSNSIIKENGLVVNKKVGSSKDQFFGHLPNNSIDENWLVVNKIVFFSNTMYH